MERIFIRKMIDRCLTNYFGDLELSPLTEKEYEDLIEQIRFESETQQSEEIYTIVHDRIYSFLAAND